MAARPWLTPLVPVYRLAVALRGLGLRMGLEPVRRLRWPVISIGNLTAGGAGKTPLTIALIKALTERGLYVDVLSRGYGRRSALPFQVDPCGTAEKFGDEPILIARETGAPVYVAAQRYEGGLLAERDASSSCVHLLDDGFQHRQLYRDVNILLLDGQTWFSERLLPAGNLREPLSAMRRADVLAIPAQEAEVLEQSLRGRAGWQGPIWRLQRNMDVHAIEWPVIAFCGIARPEQFFEGLRDAGLRLVDSIAFPDHHRYTARDLDRLREAARSSRAAAFVTTEKDRVRLGGLGAVLSESCALEIARLQIAIEEEDAAMDWLLGRLSSCLAERR
jgi:tetraacyldisaccharide 4'-kinase